MSNEKSDTRRAAAERRKKRAEKTGLKGGPFCGHRPVAGKYLGNPAFTMIECVNVRCMATAQVLAPSMETAASVWNHRMGGAQ